MSVVHYYFGEPSSFLASCDGIIERKALEVDLLRIDEVSSLQHVFDSSQQSNIDWILNILELGSSPTKPHAYIFFQATCRLRKRRASRNLVVKSEPSPVTSSFH